MFAVRGSAGTSFCCSVSQWMTDRVCEGLWWLMGIGTYCEVAKWTTAVFSTLKCCRCGAVVATGHMRHKWVWQDLVGGRCLTWLPRAFGAFKGQTLSGESG